MGKLAFSFSDSATATVGELVHCIFQFDMDFIVSSPIFQASYKDFDVNLKPAHDCMMKKCAKEWNACGKADQTRSYHTRDFLEVRN